jgi:hypothetical protein
MRTESKWGMPPSQVGGHLTLYCNGEPVRYKCFTDRLHRQTIIMRWKKDVKEARRKADYWIDIQINTHDAD